ncbi:secreted protein [Streptomyces viridosporus ATCC 14672]|uniref:Secreted protein n=1 Tax=Streptomyces viridosporus (strain ATCC 14672 / DSM 40746 / JCM 4963 / KCTC 9882 / NRRL B-12104 / FH 1290) TaxID=566461 RepID=D5ZZ54_STRV1|nr:secreted protein [Streptomyces viridosporus ATCC 14672]
MWTRARGIALALVLLIAAAVAIAVVRSDAHHGELDPRSATPYGSRAVAELLADRGVDTRVVTTLDEAVDAVSPDTTLLVAVPDLLTGTQQTRLHAATADAGGRTVLVASGSASVERLVPGVTADPATSLDSTLSPACDLPAARRAGTADTGGIRYITHLTADTCYPSERLATLLRVPAPSGNGDTVLLGAPDILLNDRLDEHGNASLALQLLGSRPHLVWYLPSLADASAVPEDERSFFDLLPSGWLWGTLQLFIAAALAALWRARRLGPLVPERLPVAIRASETVEGRARLYRKANARDRAAAALRSTTRTRLAPLVGIPVTRAHTPEALLPALSAHLQGDGQSLHALLFGPPPDDDAALVSLADRLDALEREVRRP